MSNVRLGRLVRVVSAGAVPIKGEVAGEPAPGLYPGFSASGQDVWLPKDRAPFREVGLVLSAVGARCGRVFLSPEGTWGVVANTAVLLPTSWAEPGFLYYLLNQSNFWATGGGAQPYVQLDASMSRHVPLITFEEQRRIADFLDDRVARIDQIVAARHRAVSLAAEALQARIEVAYETAVKQGPTVALGRTATIKTSSVDKHIRDGEHPVRLLNYVDVYRGDRVQPSAAAMAATATLEEINRFRLHEGDSVITKDSEDPEDIGVSAFVERSAPDFVCAYHLAILRPGPDLVPRYLTWAVRSRRVLTHFSLHSNGISRYGLPLTAIGSAPIPLPCISVQQTLADQLDRWVAGVESLRGAHAQAIARLAEYKQSLITAAVSGELDVSSAASGIPG